MTTFFAVQRVQAGSPADPGSARAARGGVAARDVLRAQWPLNSMVAMVADNVEAHCVRSAERARRAARNVPCGPGEAL